MKALFLGFIPAFIGFADQAHAQKEANPELKPAVGIFSPTRKQKWEERVSPGRIIGAAFLIGVSTVAAFAEDGPPDGWIVTYMHRKSLIGAETPVSILGKRRINGGEYDVYVSAGLPNSSSWYQVHCVQLMSEQWLCTVIENPFYEFLIPNTAPALPAASAPVGGAEDACIVSGSNLFDGKGKYLGAWQPGTALSPECKLGDLINDFAA